VSATTARDGRSTGEMILRLWPRPLSCGEARHAVRSFCLTNNLPHLADDAELLASELIANAIKHAHALVTVIAVCVDEQLLVNVRDDDAEGGSPVATVATAEAESGRGLHLVGQIAGSWGTTRHPDGKSVWFRLP